MQSRSLLSSRRLFRLHGWLGLNLGLLLFLVCFSGSWAVFSHEIDWLIDPDLRVAPSAERVDWTAVMQGVQTALPYHHVSLLLAPRRPGFAAQAVARSPAGRSEQAYVHPRTGALRRVASSWNVQRFFRSFHRRMFVPGPPGIVWVTSFALLLGVQAASGLLVHRRWYRHPLRLRRRRLRLLLSDGHRLAGVWGLPFAALVVGTGAWYGLEVFAPAPAARAPEIGTAAVEARGPAPALLPLGEQVRIAERALPGLEAREVVPGTPWQPTRVRGPAEAWLVRPAANVVHVDPVTGEVLAVRPATAMGPHRRWAETADRLHFGTFGGLASQALWLALGLVLSSLMLTGGGLWHLRAERRARSAGANPHPRWSHAAAALPVAVVLGSAVLGAWELGRHTAAEAPRPERVARAAVGPWRAEVVRRGALRAGERARLDVYLFAEGGTPNPRRATASLACAACAHTAEARAARPLSFALPVPASADPATLALELRVEAGGRLHAARLPLSGGARPGPPLDEGPAPIPPAVWAVIAGFGAVTLAVVGAWLVLAQRTARRRARWEAERASD